MTKWKINRVLKKKKKISMLTSVLLNFNGLPKREEQYLGETCKQPKVNLADRKRRENLSTTKSLAEIEYWQVKSNHKERINWTTLIY